jgi:SNF2 family DNA or RNA helicase
MNNNEVNKIRIINLLESLSELAGEDMDAAREVLRAAGKDPDLLVSKGIAKLKEIQKHYNSGYISGKLKSNILPETGIEVLLFNEDTNTIYMEKYSGQHNIIKANDVFSTFIKGMPLKNVAVGDLILKNEIGGIKYLRFVKKLFFTISIDSKSATVSPYIASLNGNILVSFADLDAVIKTGYFIDKDVKLNKLIWVPIDQDAIDFAKIFVEQIGNQESIEIKTALYYFSKRREHRWIKFEPEELDLEKVFVSSDFEKESNLFTKTLYDYQKDGVKWIQYCALNGIGGILGDDMGLGKTAQIIAAVAGFIQRKVFDNILIVVPTTLIENWRREFEFFTPSLKPYIHHGGLRGGSVSELESQSLVITSYSMIINDLYLFNKIEWGIVIIDEASLIKNPKSSRKTELAKLPAQVRIAMTGTPVENSLMDLWSITDFVMPGYLGTSESFRNKYIHSSIDKTIESSNLEQLRADISYIMLRRKKEDVLDSLPERIDIHQPLVMNKREAVRYDELRSEILAKSQNEEPVHIFSQIMELRQFTTHAMLANGTLVNADIDEMRSASVKFERTVELLIDIKERGEKVLIFTEYLDMIDALKRVLSSYFSTSIFTIDGRVEMRERQTNIDLFSAVEGFSIMILNPRTAGMGLNITAANHVIHYTRQWNPALEEQASARSYRNGQKKGVNIYYLFYADTIEETIDERLRSKLALAGEVITTTEDEIGIDQYLNALNKSPLNK